MNKCCGTCQLWKQVTKLNRPPIGKCLWRPDPMPFWFGDVVSGSMLFEADGEDCGVWVEKVKP